MNLVYVDRGSRHVVEHHEDLYSWTPLSIICMLITLVADKSMIIKNVT